MQLPVTHLELLVRLDSRRDVGVCPHCRRDTIG